MIKFVTKAILNSVAILVAAYLLSPHINVDDALVAIKVALVLGLLNTFIKPLLIILTIPITLVTLGLFLLVINVLIIYWASQIVDGFRVENWAWALLFSFLVSITSSILERFINKYNTKEKEEKIQEF